jgi:pilus assembly protein TadC
MVQWTVESYLGREYEKVLIFSAIGVVGAFIAFFAYLNWRKREYTQSSKD